MDLIKKRLRIQTRFKEPERNILDIQIPIAQQNNEQIDQLLRELLILLYEAE